MSTTTQHVAVGRSGVRTAVQRRGAGPPLLLLHGAEADHRMMEPLAGFLQANATIITYDQRDCGATIHDHDAYTMADLASDMIDVLDSMGIDRVDVVGQSLGGVIAQLAATRWPDRVDRLVLASTFRAGASLAEVNPGVLHRIITFRSWGEAGAASAAALFTTPEFIDRHPEFIETWRAIGPTTTLPQRARRTAAITQPIDLVDLTAIRAKTLVIGGSRDEIVPAEHTAALANDIPGARLVMLDDVGHASPLQAPAQLADAIQTFLAE